MQNSRGKKSELQDSSIRAKTTKQCHHLSSSVHNTGGPVSHVLGFNNSDFTLHVPFWRTERNPLHCGTFLGSKSKCDDSTVPFGRTRRRSSSPPCRSELRSRGPTETTAENNKHNNFKTQHHMFRVFDRDTVWVSTAHEQSPSRVKLNEKYPRLIKRWEGVKKQNTRHSGICDW